MESDQNYDNAGHDIKSSENLSSAQQDVYERGVEDNYVEGAGGA